MKTHIYKTMLLVLIILTGCSKNHDSKSETENAYRLKVVKFQNQEDPGLKKMLYRLFSSEEKLMFWKEHISISLQKESYKTNPKAIALIHELENMLSKEMFEDGSSANSISSAYFKPIWLKNAETVFTSKQIGELVYSNFLDKQNIIKSNTTIARNAQTVIVKTPNFEKLVNCFCEVGETGFSCKKTEIGFPSGVTVTIGICERANPCEEHSGCGWFWAYDCNGGHCNFG